MANESLQNATVERLLADGWQIYPHWDLRPWGGPVVLQREQQLVGVGPDGRKEPVEAKDLPSEDARWLRRQNLKDRLLKPFWLFRQWLGTFRIGLVRSGNKWDEVRFSEYRGGIASGRWVCRGQPELDDARWLRIGRLWVSWPIWWWPGSLKRARRRYHGQ